MIDPKEFYNSIQKSIELANGAHNATPNEAMIIENVKSTITAMMDQMNTVKQSVEDQLASHQNMQKAETPESFEVKDIDDLRTTQATGFPRELVDTFFKAFKP